MKSNQAIQDFTRRVKEIYRDKIKKIILFGSYARGDYDESSDIDMLLIMDVDEGELKKYDVLIDEVTCDLNLKYGELFSPVFTTMQRFNQWKEVLPLYINIAKEGVVLYE